jgi:hypothetical protein
VPAWGGSTTMTCRTAVGLLLGFIERTLQPGLTGDVASHFDRCPACVRFMATYRKTTALCRRALTRKAPAGLERRLMHYLHEKTGGRSSTTRESG